MFALIDGNSFFASCERVFRPDLLRKPVIVLSNNDGCVVARTQEAKDLGIKMGEPFFRIEKLVQQQGVAVFSSNYELYGDLSDRMMKTIASLVPAIEVYSIDEAFADFTGLTNLSDLGHQIKRRVLQWVGIPTCVGIAKTKTLAKFSNHLAKKNSSFQGVCNWEEMSEGERIHWMKKNLVTEIWGIGSKTGEKLAKQDINSVYDFFNASPSLIRSRYGVTVERTLRELHGSSCLELDDVVPKQKQIIRTRSFAEHVIDKDQLKAAITMHMHSAAAKLRTQNSMASCVGILIYSNRFRPEKPQHFGWDTAQLPSPSCDTFNLSRAAYALLDRLYRPEIEYKKAGVVLMDISDGTNNQLDLLNPGDTEKQLALMSVLDQINARYGRKALVSAAEMVGSGWHMRRNKLSSTKMEFNIIARG